MLLNTQLAKTKATSIVLASLATTKKHQVLRTVAKALVHHTNTILAANGKDLRAVPKDYAMTDRLTLTEQRISEMASSIVAITQLADPIGELLAKTKRPSGLQIEQRRVPLGVVGVIYEARPNVTLEVWSLCFKTGNAVVLKGGSDAYRTNQVLVQIIQTVLRQYHLPVASVLLLDPKNRTVTTALLQARQYVDIVIPRGSERLIQFVRETATVPVIETGAGVCHTFVEKTADLKLAASVVTNAKVRRCTVCNALDCLVVERSVLKPLLILLAPLLQTYRVEIRADQPSFTILKQLYPKELLKRASLSDYGKEFLSLRMSIKTVTSAQAGIAFVQRYTSGHSEAIITNNKKLADQFQQVIDAAAVYVNTSTAFTDGFEFGLGAEVGIATQKLHARGPMGLTALTTGKWLVHSNGAIRKP